MKPSYIISHARTDSSQFPPPCQTYLRAGFGYYAPVSEISSHLTRVKMASLTGGWSSAELGPFFFGILILRGGHAAFGILALKRIFFPCHAVSELFHELLALGAGDKVGKQQSGVR